MYNNQNNRKSRTKPISKKCDGNQPGTKPSTIESVDSVEGLELNAYDSDSTSDSEGGYVFQDVYDY